MPKETVWLLEPHTAAKHALLKKYLGAWFPILGSTGGRVVFLDGFAGPGNYDGGEPGSPIIALSALIDHSYFATLGQCEFVFVFNENDPDRYRCLEANLKSFQASRSPWPSNVRVRPSNEDFAVLAKRLASHGQSLAPTFAFIDPFGYKGLELQDLADLLAADRCELFCYFDFNSAQRFATAGNVDGHFEALFACEDFKKAPPAGTPDRGEFLIRLFERQLGKVAKFNHVQSFAMRNRMGILGHYLVFATRSLTGLDKMKQVMWKIDPRGGYSFSDRLAGQEVLFGDAADTRPLRDALLHKFSGMSVPIQEVIDWVVAETPYHSGHVKRATLKPMEDDQLVSAVGRSRRGTYPGGCTVTFLSR
ncbi:three-Cys-motif partner protein TcmP [Nigerium massiliense]|uniref:three-Cys-motif partner protein TcmP n=1 Tax=Nigerium massiliense TaxID=1522317 RepID=UPI00058B5588|nr:three-Cys-motif partner protein TcmP [Nigerium massiliense]